MDIKLNFINRSNDQNNSQIVIFMAQTSPGEAPIAWRVIQNCAPGDSHPFIYPVDVAVGAADADGNFTPQLPAQNGDVFQMAMTPSGHVLSLKGTNGPPGAVSIENALPRQAINALIYKDGLLFASWPKVMPNEIIAIQIKPVLKLGAVSQVEQGSVLNSAIVSAAQAEISLVGIASADIVMTGGGSGPKAEPFRFTLENIIP